MVHTVLGPVTLSKYMFQMKIYHSSYATQVHLILNQVITGILCIRTFTALKLD